MIQAQDLKIGNWVLLTKDEFKTTKPYELDAFDIYKASESDCADIAPIQLTEETLLKCGFEVKKSPICDFYHINISWNNTYKELSLSIQQGNQYVYLREQNDELPNDRMADNIVCIFNGDIHGKLYLHKLQNIVHVLTNTELEINL